MEEPDALFADARLASLYDALEGDRDDLDVYAAIVVELDARSVLDVGSGTGTFAHLLADRGNEVVAVEPAGASLAVARTKPGAERVRWIHGDATTLPDLQVDLATMTANVAQVFTTDDAWAANLAGIAAAVRPGGHLVFETRVPARRAWERWNPTDSFQIVEDDERGPVASWHEVTDVDLPLVTFRSTIRFDRTGEEVVSSSTLRFRERDEIEASLEAARFRTVDVRNAPDRPGLEWVFVARRQS
ncbi:MAG: class I SAM-dependent methyltransferase [Actinomycetota bacterium]